MTSPARLRLRRQLAEVIALVPTTVNPWSLAEHYAHVRYEPKAALRTLSDLRSARAADPLLAKLRFDPRSEEAVVVAMTFVTNDLRYAKRPAATPEFKEALALVRQLRAITPLLRQQLSSTEHKDASFLARLLSVERNRRSVQAAVKQLEYIDGVVGAVTEDVSIAELHHGLSVPVQSAIDLAEVFNAQWGKKAFTVRSVAALFAYWGIDAGPNPASRFAAAWRRRKAKQWFSVGDEWTTDPQRCDNASRQHRP